MVLRFSDNLQFSVYFVKEYISLYYIKSLRLVTLGNLVEDGGVDRSVIECRQNQLGQMADFPPLLTFLVFDLMYLKLIRPCGTHKFI